MSLVVGYGLNYILCLEDCNSSYGGDGLMGVVVVVVGIELFRYLCLEVVF